MTKDKIIQVRAWGMYCEETKNSPAAVDFPHQVPKAYWEDLLTRAALKEVDHD